MLNLPIVFLCNTLLFLAVLNGRFRMVTQFAVSAVAYVLSLVANLIFSPVFNDTSGIIGNGINAAILLAAAVFLFTNNIMQKIFVAILVVCNYHFLLNMTEALLGVLPFPVGGLSAMFTGILVYIFFTFLSMITFVRPFHYLTSRNISVLSVGLCVAQLLCLFLANGLIPAIFGITTYAPVFFLVLLGYLLVAFSVRVAYNSAKSTEASCTAEHRAALLRAEADYINAMVGTVNNGRSVHEHNAFVLEEIREYAKNGNCEAILNTLADQGSDFDPMLTHYSENPYVNAVIATKSAYAKHEEIRLESNVELGNTKLKTIEFCAIINDVLSHAISSAVGADLEDKLVRLTVLTVENRVTFEAVYPAAHTTMIKRLTDRSVSAFLASLFEPKHQNALQLDTVRGIMERYSGTMNLSTAGTSEILRIVINN